jgi:hypothetical protein
VSPPNTGDRVHVSVGAAGVNWDAVIDLGAGTFTRTGSRDDRVDEPIPPPTLKTLRAQAAAAHAAGDVRVREQFADGGVAFDIWLGGTPVQLSYETWGGGHYGLAEPLWDYACRA